MNLKKTLFMVLIAVLSIFGITSVNALTINDNGKYTLILTSSEENVTIDGENQKIIKFNVTEGETTVKLSELTNGIVPFNGRTEFSHWGSFTGERVNDVIALTEFKWSGDLADQSYTNGLTLYASFSDKILQGTGTYYLTLDPFAGKVNGQSIIKLTSKSTEFKTVELTKYIPVRKGYTFSGWELDGKFVTSIDSSYFTNRDCITITATYTQDSFNGDGIVLKLNANGGKIDGKESNSYDYIGGGNSGTTMSLLPYIPVREGYTFNGWNTKKDGNAIIIFDKEITKNYVLDIKEVEVKKDLANKNIKYIVDINVLENGQVVKINDTKMKIKIALPEDLKGYSKYEVVYILDDEIKETIEAKVENGYIVFETSHLSHYGIVAIEDNNNNNIVNPKTNDDIVMYFISSIISLVGVTGVLIYYKKNKTN